MRPLVDTRNYRVKTLNNLNPAFMNFLSFSFERQTGLTNTSLTLEFLTPDINKVPFGGKSSRYLRPNIWNLHWLKTKLGDNLSIFKRIIKVGMQFHANARLVSPQKLSLNNCLFPQCRIQNIELKIWSFRSKFG